MAKTLEWQGSGGVVRIRASLIVAGLDFGHGDPMALEVLAKAGAWLAIDEVYRERPGIDGTLRACLAYTSRYGIERIWADPARPELIAHLQSHGLPVYANQVRDLDYGIATVYGLLRAQMDHPALGPGPRLRVNRRQCPMLVEEAGRYRYPEVRGEIAGKRPIDRWNHAWDAVRYALVGEGETPPEVEAKPPVEEQPTMYLHDGQWHDNPLATIAQARAEPDDVDWWDQILTDGEPWAT